MSETNASIQAVAVPYGWEDDQLLLGIVTAHRSRNWTLPKASISAAADAAEAASNEALRQGGFLGLPGDSPLLLTATKKGTELRCFAIEISGLFDTWDAQRYQSRKLVPIGKIEKYIKDRTSRQAIRTLLEQRLDVTVSEVKTTGSST